MLIIGRGTNGSISASLQITLWIQQCFEWFLITASYRALFSSKCYIIRLNNPKTAASLGRYNTSERRDLPVSACVRAERACVTADPVTRQCWHAAPWLTWACVAQRRRVGLWSHGDGSSSTNELELRERLRLGRTCNGETRVVMLFSFLTSVGSFSWSGVNTWATTSAPVSAHSAQPLAVSFISGLDVFKHALLLFPVAKTVGFCITCDVAELSFNSKLSYLRT